MNWRLLDMVAYGFYVEKDGKRIPPEEVMIDANEQALKEHQDKEVRYQKAYDALIPIVMDDYTLFESFLMDEYQEVYDKASDKELKDAFNSFRRMRAIDWCSHDPRKSKWLEYVHDETIRRLEG